MPDVPAQLQQSAAPPTAPGQPPFGSSPVSQPVPNRGLEAAGLSQLSVIVRQLEQVVPMLGAASEPGQAAIKALSSLAKHVPPGAVTPGVQQSTMERLMAQAKQMGPQIAQMRAQSQGPQPQAQASPQ